jgi:N-acetylmuramoyl-L-alanine amidase
VSARAARAFVLALAAGLQVATLERPRGLGEVTGVRHWSYPAFTRVVVELSRAVETHVERLPADPRAQRPERLYIDLPDVWVGLRYDEPHRVEDGLLQRVRVGQNTRATTRVVLDLASYRRHRLSYLSGPDRIVLDVYGDELPLAGEALRPPAPLPLGLRPVHRVVIDPGHGGDDPGAIGAERLLEKDVTLAVSLDLAARLRDRGFEVVLTREDDRTLGLEERTALAEAAGADVFVSVHVNSAPERSVSGIETYYLDASSERHTLRVAARENAVPVASLDPLQRALAGLRVGETQHRSAGLAAAIHAELVRGVRSSVGAVRDLGVKQGPFHVLFLSEAPSALVEIGFLTHPRESQRLASRLYRAVVAEQIARGLSRYRSAHATQLAQGPAR